MLSLPNWTWAPQWVLHGDSIASILFRFAYANLQSPQALKSLVSPSGYVSEAGYPLYQSVVGEGGWKILRTHLGISDVQLCKALLGDVLQALRWSRITSTRFRYCPECLDSGYHARYFQIQALANCPVHQQKLWDTCRSCGEPTPFYGLCLELFEGIYRCPHCNASFAHQPISIRRFFEPEIDSARLQEIWRPLDEWIATLDCLSLDFASLRGWIVAYAGENQAERQIDALHVVGSVLPLPKGRFVWRQPSTRRRAFYFSEGGGRQLRGGRFSKNHIDEAYLEIRQYVEDRLPKGCLVDLKARCRQESWGVAQSLKSVPKLAYILWRVKLEHLTEPALLAMPDAGGGVFMDGETYPLPFWSLTKPGWKILFLAMYRSYSRDVMWAMENDVPCADVLRYSPLHQCCILPSTDMNGRGRGAISYVLCDKQKTPA